MSDILVSVNIPGQVWAWLTSEFGLEPDATLHEVVIRYKEVKTRAEVAEAKLNEWETAANSNDPYITNGGYVEVEVLEAVKRRNAKLLARTKDLHDQRWDLLSQQIELLRRLEERASVLDLKLALGSAANTVELLKDIADHEHKRTEEAEAKVAGLTFRCECAEHAAAFVDTYARYYHEHQLARMNGRESEHPYTFDVWYILSDDVGRRTRALMREGELVVSDSEGGFGPDEISIGGDNMSELIAGWMGLQLNSRGSLAPIKEGRSELGLVRLIMERL